MFAKVFNLSKRNKSSLSLICQPERPQLVFSLENFDNNAVKTEQFSICSFLLENVPSVKWVKEAFELGA